MKRATLSIVYPSNFTTDERIAWHKEHSELKELEFSKQAMARFSKVRSAVDSIGWQLMRCYQDSEKYSWSHKKQLDYLSEWIYNTAKYRKLPTWAKNEIAGMVWVLSKQQDRKLVWTHLIDGVRVESGAKVLKGRYNEIKSEESHHCWKTAEGFVIFS